LDAGDIHRDQILGHLLPFASTPARVYMEHFGPQPKNSRHYIVYYANIIFWNIDTLKESSKERK